MSSFDSSVAMKNATSSFLVWAGLLFFGVFVLWVIWFSGLVRNVFVFEWEFFSACGFSFTILILLDFLSALFSFVVCLISGCVFVFSVSYMEGDKFKGSFSGLVGAFVMAMNVLIFIPNLVFVLLGWDLLGIVSFLLVIYYQNNLSVGAGMLTILMNRVGDVFLILSISLSSSVGGWGVLWVEQFSCHLMVIGVLLAGASMTKSAQIPFSVWLPAAMAAPTPVSALVHSSTLVTVGVYFLFRHYCLLSCVEGLFPFLSKIGCLTLMMSSMGACFELDIKKLIALSTLSHLSFMIYVMGIGYPTLGVFHMLSHALFKSLLFLCAGHYIHTAGSCQDLRQMAGLAWSSSPSLVSCTFAGLSSLCGFPYLSGFYSKDAIIEGSVSHMGGFFEVLFLVIGASASCLYSMRLLLYSTFGPMSSFPLRVSSVDSLYVSVPIFVLSVGGIIFGYIMQQVWVEACESFSLSFFTKMWLFSILNFGFFILFIDSFNFEYEGDDEGGSGERLKFVGLFLSSFWFLRWWFVCLPELWFKYGVRSVMALEMGWMEVIGGQGVSSTMIVPSVNLVAFEGISVLLVLRLTGIFLMALGLFLL
uniref:NADH-ubiquinone oxidoreductase chain 5 n=1 Tax=Solenaia carinata TaxID=1903492 RepID=V9NEI8_9BIVA|nr:NADH dehydrogenase subunit 5 [Solenaia carinata]